MLNPLTLNLNLKSLSSFPPHPLSLSFSLPHTRKHSLHLDICVCCLWHFCISFAIFRVVYAPFPLCPFLIFPAENSHTAHLKVWLHAYDGEWCTRNESGSCLFGVRWEDRQSALFKENKALVTPTLHEDKITQRFCYLQLGLRVHPSRFFFSSDCHRAKRIWKRKTAHWSNHWSLITALDSI